MKSNKDLNYNLVIYVQLIFTALGVMWLSLNEVKSGTIYTTMFVVVSVLFLLSFLFVKEQEDKTYGKFKAPLETDYDIAIPLYLIGWSLPFLMNFLFGLVSSGFSVTSFMIPLAGSSIDGGIVQSFSVAEIEADPFIRLFMMVFVAGTIEEMLFGWFLVAMFYLMSKFILTLLNDGKDFSFMKAETFNFWFAMVGTMLVFSAIHTLNSSYVGYMFLIAMAFRLIMNLSIYAWGLFITFTVAFHQSNNFIYAMENFGIQAVQSALFSIKGLVIITMFVFMLIYTLRRFDTIQKKVGNLFTN